MKRCYPPAMSSMRGIAAGIGYSVIFGFSFMMTKETLEILSPVELLAARFLIAALLMSALVALGAIHVDFRAKSLKLLALMCLSQPVAYFIFETYGIANSATNVAGIILGALPAGVAIMGAFVLGERLTANQSVGLATSVVGVMFVALFGRGNTAETRAIGVLFLTGAMLSAVLFNVVSKKAAETFSPTERTFAMMWSGAICFGVPALWQNVTGKGHLSVLFGALEGRVAAAWGGILYLGTLSSVAAFFLINYSLTYLKASQSAVFTNLVTVITVLAGIFIRHEAFSWSQGASLGLIVLGIAVANAKGAT